MKQWIDRLRRERTLRPEEFRQLLTECDAELLRYINKQAQEVSLLHFGNKIYIRGLIEISNCCRNNCYYCGIRKGNPNIERYRLTQESILDCCKQGYESGFRTFVLQGGEDPVLTDDKIERIVTNIRQEYPDCAITLSLGEKSRNTYERFFKGFYTLPEVDQVILQSLYQDDMSREELARKLGIKPTSIRTYISRAKKHALQLMRGEFDEK